MLDLYYAVCNAICALPLWQMALVSLVCVFIVAGVIWFALWGLKALLCHVLERVGVNLDPEYEPFEADWMDFDAWEEPQGRRGFMT